WALLATLVPVGAVVYLLVAFGADAQLRRQMRSNFK
ncbi:MAG: hypothetical protein GW799_19835, partial [Shewanella frigidimarina]|nr:hypothetical protein [Shewanella frigidimarina]